MSDSRAELTQALETLLRAIGPPPAPAAEIQAALRRVDGLTQSLGPDTPPQLRHFLQRRSYIKALEYLQSG
ncbi:MAG: hypothetical protein OXO54_00215 [Chloroflexota bacterium]|nr:hypothetical protein [Chloroflexota bacterium]MDE2896726.1 hypothetical protein [Chloroflexota bacterium]